MNVTKHHFSLSFNHENILMISNIIRIKIIIFDYTKLSIENDVFLDHYMKLCRMIEIYLNYDNMHTIRTINVFICINNHVNSCINSMLSGCPSHVEKYEIDKLESTTELCRFVGYPKDTFR